MKTKNKKTKRVKVVDEMPKFKRTTRIGVDTARVEKKKMHTSTKPIVKKEKPKSINGNLIRKLKFSIKKLSDMQSILNNKYIKLEKAANKFSDSNNKENSKSLKYNVDDIMKYCDKIESEVQGLRKVVVDVDEDYNKKITKSN